MRTQTFYQLVQMWDASGGGGGGELRLHTVSSQTVTNGVRPLISFFKSFKQIEIVVLLIMSPLRDIRE